MRTRKNRKKNSSDKRASQRKGHNAPRRFLVTFGPILAGFLVLAVGISIRVQPSALPPPILPDSEGLDPELARRIQALSNAVAAQPTDPDRHGELGILYEAHGYRRLARVCYDNAVTVDGSRTRWHHHAGVAALQDGDLAFAESAFRRVIRQKPEYIPAHERLAYLLLDREAFEEAEERLTLVVKTRPDMPQGYVGLAKVKLGTDRIESAVAHLHKALAIEPAYAEAHYLLGRAYQKLGRTRDAEVELARGGHSEPSLFSDPWHASINRARMTLISRQELASEWIRHGRLEDAARELETLRQRYPESTAVINNLSVAYKRMNRMEDARQLLQSALDDGSNHPTVHVSLARVLMEQGRLDEALSHADIAISRAPMLGPAHFSRGVILVRLRKYTEAVEAFREATRRDAGDPEAYLNIGRVLADLHRFAEAEDALRTAIAIEPQSAVARYELATVYQRQGRLVEAAENLEKAVELDPHDEGAREALRSLHGAQE